MLLNWMRPSEEEVGLFFSLMAIQISTQWLLEDFALRSWTYRQLSFRSSPQSLSLGPSVSRSYALTSWYRWCYAVRCIWDLEQSSQHGTWCSKIPCWLPDPQTSVKKYYPSTTPLNLNKTMEPCPSSQSVCSVDGWQRRRQYLSPKAPVWTQWSPD